MEIPTIHVEDTSQYQQPGVDMSVYNAAAGLNNLEVLRKIDALLGHNLDLSNLTGITLAPDQAQGNGTWVSNSFIFSTNTFSIPLAKGWFKSF